MFNFDLANISKYRTELMGVAAIFIILCHIPANIPQIPSITSFILSALGMFGNPIFFFLSGVGLYYSLQNKKIEIGKWYLKRYIRLFIPYILISFVIQVIYISIGNISIGDSIRYLTGISYWQVGNGAWFVWALVPMYLSAPILMKIFDQKFLYNVINVIFLCLLILSVNLLDDNICQSIVSIKSVCSNFPAFIIGIWSGKYIMLKKSVNLFIILLVHIVAIIIRIVFDLHFISMVTFAICPSVIIACFIVRYLYSLKSLFVFFGGISLESYLFNTSLPGLFRSIPIINSNINDPFRYLLVVAVGIGLSKPIHNLSKRIGEYLMSFRK